MKLAITGTLPSDLAAPMVLRGSIDNIFATAARLGFEGVELSFCDPREVEPETIIEASKHYRLEVSAIGTGLARARDGIDFASSRPEVTNRAVERLKDNIRLGAAVGAPVILGLLRGNLPRERGEAGLARERILAAMRECASFAQSLNVTILLEPINRYETNFINTLEEGIAVIEQIGMPNVSLMADVFHMNIEERDVCESLLVARRYLRYVHFADSNRHAPGTGHLDFKSVVGTLRRMGYDGYISLEFVPEKDGEQEAARSRDLLIKLMRGV